MKQLVMDLIAAYDDDESPNDPNHRTMVLADMIRVMIVFLKHHRVYARDECRWMQSFRKKVNELAKTDETGYPTNGVCSPSQLLDWYCVFQNEPSLDTAYMYSKYHCDHPAMVSQWVRAFASALPLEPQSMVATRKYGVAFHCIQVEVAVAYWNEYGHDVTEATRAHRRYIIDHKKWPFLG